MKRPLIYPAVFCLLLLTLSCTIAKRTMDFEMPPMILPGATVLDLAALEKKYSDYDGAILSIKTTIEHYGGREELAGGWKFARMVQDKYIVLNPKSIRLTTFRRNFMPERMYVRITNPDGTVQTFSKRDLKEETDVRGRESYVLILPNIVKGSIVETGSEYIYGVSYFLPQLEYNIKLQYSVPVEQLDFSFSYPDWWKVSVKKLGPKERPAIVNSHDVEKKKKTIAYHAINVDGITKEPWAPYFKEVAKYLTFKVDYLEMKGTSWRRPTTWDKVAKDLKDDYFGRRRRGQKEVDALAARLIDSSMSGYEKMVAVTSWVRDSIELGGKGHNGHNGSILKDRDGSVFDISSLTRKLLAKAGIDSWMTIAHSRDDGYFDQKYISLRELGIVSIRTNVDSVEYVLYPWLKHLPVTHIPPYFQGQPALLLEGSSSGFWRIPDSSSFQNNKYTEYEVTLDSEGMTHVFQRSVLHGYVAYGIRDQMEDKDKDQRQELLLEEFVTIDGDPLLDSFKVFNEDTPDRPLEIEMFYRVDQLVTVMPDEVIFQSSGLFAPFANIQHRIDAKKRKNPISIDLDENLTQKIIISYPNDWTLATAVEDVSYSNEFGSATGIYLSETSQLSVEMTTKLKRCREPRQKFSELLALTGKRHKLDIPTLVFSINPGI